MGGTSMPLFCWSQIIIERAVGLPRWPQTQNIVVDIDSFRCRIYVKECRRVPLMDARNKRKQRRYPFTNNIQQIMFSLESLRYWFKFSWVTRLYRKRRRVRSSEHHEVIHSSSLLDYFCISPYQETHATRLCYTVLAQLRYRPAEWCK